MTVPPRKRSTPINVRGDLVGEEEAEQLDVDDDRTTALATMVFGGVLLVLSVAVIVQAVRLDNGGNTVGPATAPWVIGVSLLLVGVLTVVRGRRDMGVWEVSEHTTRPGLAPARHPGRGAAGLRGADPVPRVRRLRDAPLRRDRQRARRTRRGQMFAVGFSVAAVVWLLFDVGIGISLPAGPWGF